MENNNTAFQSRISTFLSSKASTLVGSGQGSNLTLIFGDLSHSEKLSEIKPPLTAIKSKKSNSED